METKTNSIGPPSLEHLTCRQVLPSWMHPARKLEMRRQPHERHMKHCVLYELKQLDTDIGLIKFELYLQHQQSEPQ